MGKKSSADSGARAALLEIIFEAGGHVHLPEFVVRVHS